MPNFIDRTKEVLRQMQSLLDDPHPGLATWNEALLARKRELDQLLHIVECPDCQRRRADAGLDV